MQGSDDIFSPIDQTSGGDLFPSWRSYLQLLFQDVGCDRPIAILEPVDEKLESFWLPGVFSDSDATEVVVEMLRLWVWEDAWVKGAESLSSPSR